MLSRDRPTDVDEAGVDLHWMQREKDWDQGLVLQHSQLGLALIVMSSCLIITLSGVDGPVLFRLIL